MKHSVGVDTSGANIYIREYQFSLSKLQPSKFISLKTVIFIFKIHIHHILSNLPCQIYILNWKKKISILKQNMENVS